MKALRPVRAACLLAGAVPPPLPAHGQEEDPEAHWMPKCHGGPALPAQDGE